jgi:pimeloyl-ACP methyl ester carboxylesterase
MSAPVDAWRSRGRDHELLGQRVFVVEVPATGPVAAPPLLVLHGFPTSSFDFHRVVDALAADRRVVLFDMLGYGLSAKPDRPYRLVDQADLAQALVADLGIDRLGLLTHDIGDSVGGELLARQLEGAWPVEVTDRVVTNGTLYMDLVQLSAGQQLLEALPDARLDAGALTRDNVVGGLIATFSPDHRVDDTELAAAWELISAGEFTPPVVDHPSPLTVVWGIDDPIAVPAMADRLAGARPDARVVRLAGVGHYPMVEVPARFVAAVLGRD